MWDFFKNILNPEPPEPPPAEMGMVTRPIVVAASESEFERFRQNAYRLDAIKRYIEQNEPIPATKRREFLLETMTRADFLLREGQIDQAQHDAFIERVTLAKTTGA